MFGDFGFGIVIEAMKNSVHNVLFKWKAPYREKKRQKYKKRYNDEQYFEKLSKRKNDIMLYNKHYNYSFSGNGNYLCELIQQYRKNGTRVKLVTTGQKHGYAEYFQEQLGMTYTEVWIRSEKEEHERKFQEFVENDVDILSMDQTQYIPKEKREKDYHFLSHMLKKVAKQAKQEPDVVYLLCFLFVQETDEAIVTLEKGKNMRYCFFHIDHASKLKKANDDSMHVVIPRYERRELGNNTDVEEYKKIFSPLPSWIFYKEYYAYYSFVYKQKDEVGMYFMHNYKKTE